MTHHRFAPLTICSTSQEQTEKIGETIGKNLAPGDHILLNGELGAGKTALVRGIATGWGSTIQATSPTFAIINRYQSPDKPYFLYHVDAYRLSGFADALSTGIEDILTELDSTAIEWPDRISAFLPEGCVIIDISTTGPDDRIFSISGPEETVKRLFQA